MNLKQLTPLALDNNDVVGMVSDENILPRPLLQELKIYCFPFTKATSATLSFSFNVIA